MMAVRRLPARALASRLPGPGGVGGFGGFGIAGRAAGTSGGINGVAPGEAGAGPRLPIVGVPSADNVLETLRTLEAEGADLRAQIRVSNSLHRKRNDLLLTSLQHAQTERVELQEQLTQLTKDFHVMAETIQAESLSFRKRVQRKGIEGQGGQSRMAYRPEHNYALKQPTHVCELSHQSLAEMAMLGNHCSRRERLLREVMCVDGISWGQAHDVINKFDKFNERFYWIETMPYRIGITAAFLGGLASIALVFWSPVAVWYGLDVAGEELPDGVKDIDELTVNQVGTWTWSWMEPMIGTASFVLLCCQFIRGQAVKMNMRSYSEQLLHWRADRLCKAFPGYDQSMLRAWAKHMPQCGLHFFPTFERKLRQKGPSSGL